MINHTLPNEQILINNRTIEQKSQTNSSKTLPDLLIYNIRCSELGINGRERNNIPQRHCKLRICHRQKQRLRRGQRWWQAVAKSPPLLRPLSLSLSVERLDSTQLDSGELVGRGKVQKSTRAVQGPFGVRGKSSLFFFFLFFFFILFF